MYVTISDFSLEYNRDSIIYKQYIIILYNILSILYNNNLLYIKKICLFYTKCPETDLF